MASSQIELFRRHHGQVLCFPLHRRHKTITETANVILSRPNGKRHSYQRRVENQLRLELQRTGIDIVEIERQILKFRDEVNAAIVKAIAEMFPCRVLDELG